MPSNVQYSLLGAKQVPSAKREVCVEMTRTRTETMMQVDKDTFIEKLLSVNFSHGSTDLAHLTHQRLLVLNRSYV